MVLRRVLAKKPKVLKFLLAFGEKKVLVSGLVWVKSISSLSLSLVLLF